MQVEDGKITVEELTRTLGISPTLLRLWEKEFGLPHRENGSMAAHEADEIRLISDLIQQRGMSLAEARVEFANAQAKEEAKQRALEKLRTLRQSLVKLRERL